MTLMRSYFFATGTIVLSAIAQLSLKAAMITLHGNGISDPMSMLATLGQPSAVWYFLAAGLLCYAVSMLCWMAAIAKLELSFAYPLLGISYVLVYIAAVSWPLLDEQLSWQRSIGIGIVIGGVLLVSRSGTTTPESTR